MQNKSVKLIIKVFIISLLSNIKKWGKNMQVIKKEIIESISNLPDEVEIEDIMYRLYVIDKIKKGQLAVKNNEVVSSTDLKKEIDTW